MLKQIRLKLGLTQKEMGQIMGVSGTFVAIIENGHRPFPAKRQKILMEYLATWIMVLQATLEERKNYKAGLEAESKIRGWRVFREKYNR